MKRIGNRARFLSVVMIYFLICSAMFLIKYVKSAPVWVAHPANKNVYSNGMLKSPGSVTLKDDTELFLSTMDGKSYSTDLNLRKATLHSVGDLYGNITTGVLKSQRLKFMGYDYLSGVYSVGDAGSTIRLTLDAATCKAALKGLGSRKGTVGVYNYKTGAILCMVSSPSYDPMKIPDFNKHSNTYDGVYINRLMNGVYTPGSVFKLITAAAAIDHINDLDSRTFQCNGYAEIGGERVNCAGKHGKLNFKTALAKSCNTVFAQIATELGGDILEEYAIKAGVKRGYTVNGAVTARGRFNVADAAEVNLAWSGIGQYTDLVNPFNYMVFMGAIASGGQAKMPYYIHSITSSLGLPSYFNLHGQAPRMLDADTANTLKTLMRNNVESEYGDSRFKNMALCAKTGTAEVESGKQPHAWFVGFSDNPDTPLAFVVVVENSGSGKGVALPIAQSVMAEAVKTF